ncbi:hypothetical protein EW146_g7381 [Bondarzewia mesenterica]|uniref:Uncharacterized protein n=1 Tax=Bondarzewia mesenterica TaxID=1095465 RepID=A0A4S4LKY8_9AGAM|nr:hypothetical protein EW146_g7381 [Bondarzewia mesenterica]
MDPESVENILKDSLSLTFLGESPQDDERSQSNDGRLSYGHLLGSGTALPSLLSSVLPESPSLVVVTDYPDDIILNNLRDNVKRNEHAVSRGCTVLCGGYEWGHDVTYLLSLIPPSLHKSQFQRTTGYDTVFLSVLSHFDRSHGALLASLTAPLSTHHDARSYVAAGTYTRPAVCDAFLRAAERLGIMWMQSGGGDSTLDEDDRTWLGTLRVRELDKTQLGVRKGMCRWWVGRWSDEMLRME